MGLKTILIPILVTLGIFTGTTSIAQTQAAAILPAQAIATLPQTQAVPDKPARLNVLTFNTWLLDLAGLPLASYVPERRTMIAAALRETHADVINLTEVWREESANTIVSQLKDIYPYCSFNPDKIRFGALYANGLLVLSKFPLKKSGFHYANGCERPLDELIFSDTTRYDEYAVSKGAIHNIVLHPALGAIDLFSSHLGALSFSTDTNDYDADQKAKVFLQTTELVQFMNHVSKTRSQLLMIDTNRHFREWQAHKGESTHLDPNYASFLGAGFHDSFMEAHHYDPHTLSGIYTFDIVNNANARDGAFSGAPSDFIDYIFFRSKRLRPLVSRLAFATPRALPDGTKFFLSDHFAVGTSFAIQ